MIKQFINKLMNTNKVKDMKEGTVKFFNNTKAVFYSRNNHQKTSFV